MKKGMDVFHDLEESRDRGQITIDEMIEKFNQLGSVPPKDKHCKSASN